ncbi:MAG: hypothetical protein WCC06_07225 [Candidatus Aminicenantales bacterium]
MMTRGRLILPCLFLLVFLFQIYLLTEFKWLYLVTKSIFLVLFLLMGIGLLGMPRKIRLYAVLSILLIIGLRLPFYFHADGMMFTSDNAIEALQSLEIRDTKTVPLFLLNSIGHNGTFKYLLMAFIWDFLGQNYLTFVLFQAFIFLALIYLLYMIFRKDFDPKILFILCLAHFSFMEVLFDYSLFLRAAPYLEMFFFFVLGIYLFDFSFKTKNLLFLSAYSFLFSFYINRTAIFLIVPFVVCATIFSIQRKVVFKHLYLFLAGALCGGFPVVYQLIWGPRPPDTGDWFKIVFISPSQLSLARAPQYILQLITDFKIIFKNLFSFEFRYMSDFFNVSPLLKQTLTYVNAAALFISAVVVACAAGLAAKRILGLKKRSLAGGDWSYIFFWLLFLSLLGKLFILSPHPFHEARHNMDMALLIILSYVFVLSAILRMNTLISWKPALILVLFALLTIPHYHYFLRMTRFKENSYKKIMAVLKTNNIKYLATDFTIAYPIYFFSDRKILVSDSWGPITMRFIYPELKRKVDAIPWSNKAYLLFSKAYRRTRWIQNKSYSMRKELEEKLAVTGIHYRVVNLKYYLLIVPFPAIMQE